MMFNLTDDQAKQVGGWGKDHGCPLKDQGAIGGALTYSFTPTSIGIVEKVSCACGKDLDLTDYDLW